MALDNFTIRKGLKIDDSYNSNGASTFLVKAGTPEGSVVAAIGAFCIDTTNGLVYIKNSGAGNIGWKKLAVENFLDIKASCMLASVNDTNWSTTATGAYVDATGILTLAVLPIGAALGKLDGVECVVGNRILLKDMATISACTTDDGGGADPEATPGKYNGIWVVQAAGGSTTSIALIRSEDADETAEVTTGMFAFIEKGTVNTSTGWVLTTIAITLGVTALVFAQFTAAGSYTAGNGIDISGQVISAKLDVAGGLEDNGSGSTRINVDATNDTTSVNASNEINVKGQKRIHLTTPAAPQTGYVVDTVAISTYSAIRWIIMVKNGTTGRYASEVFAVNLGTGTTVDSTEYAVMTVGTPPSGVVVAVDVNSGNMRLLLDVSTNSVSIEVLRLALDA